MNKKLIAAAVSAAIVAPVAAYGEVTVYGRINNAIDLNDIDDSPGADSTTDVSSVSSRFGIKYNKEMGNGLSAHGRYEFATRTDRELHHADGGGTQDIRIATVGLSGPFGRIDVGNQWSSYFNTFGTLVSPTYSLGYYLYSSVAGGAFRASNTIKYSNSFGPVYAELDIRLNDDSDPEGSNVAETLRGDGVGLGLSWAVTDNITLAAAWDVEDRETSGGGPAALNFTPETIANNGVLGTVPDDGFATGDFGQDEDRFGIAVKASFGGGFWGAIGWQNYEVDDLDVAITGLDIDDDGNVDNGTIELEGIDVDSYFIYGGGNFGEKTNWLIGYSEADDGVSDNEILLRDGRVSTGTDDSEQLTWGIYHNLGGGLKVYYEATNLDSENKQWDGDRHYIGMRVDF